MRPSAWLVFGLVLAGCGQPPVAAAPPPSPAVEAAIVRDDALAPEDIGAIAIGSAISVPAFHEIQLATVVFRDGAFSPSDSQVFAMLSNRDQRQPCRLVAFSPKGPLRPAADDTLVLVNGRSLRWVGGQGAMYGHDGPATLIPGAPFIRIADLVYGGREAGGYSSDVHHPRQRRLRGASVRPPGRPDT